MDKSVAVPPSLLEDIFRLLEYLDYVSSRDDLRFHEINYNPQFEHDTAIWELKMKIRLLQPQIMEAYLLTVGDITEDEGRALEKWVEAGKSIYDNPYCLCDGSGCPMDFINGYRVGLDMCRNHSDYFGDPPAEGSSDNWDNDNNEDLPF